MLANIQHLRDIVYFFEQEYPTKIYLHQIVQSDANVDLGTRKIVKAVFPVICVKLPEEGLRKFIQDISYLAANKNFTYGGLNDYTSTKWLVRKIRMPKNLIIDLNFHIVENNKRYDETKIETIWKNEVYVISGKATEGAAPFQIHEQNITHSINAYQEEHHGFN